ncbi:hypothetical protein QAD02_010785 [Eretmocerus hayati]|uniref:Uncharacterized protein n=1 Tax=Eretmocerus hayati TaxID=131215 RepID=A0ACC2NV75_9HYME|nr:hypothetical protein QAD02_010785 [Eretmocerus hayati]
MKTSAYIFVLLYLSCLAYASLKVRSKSEKIDIEVADDASLIAITLENTTIYNAECGPAEGRGRYCSLYIKTVSFDNDTDWQVCRFSIWTDHEESRIFPILQLFRFGEYKVLLSWIEYNPNITVKVNHLHGEKIDAGIFVKFMTIRLPHCVMSDFNIKGAVYPRNFSIFDYFKRGVSIFLYEDTIDVTYPYNGHDVVEESFNSEGLRIRGPVSRGNFVIGEDAVMVHTFWRDKIKKCNDLLSQERFRFASGYRLPDLPGYLFDGSQTSIKILQGWSTANGNVSFCKINALNNQIWHCAQGENTESLNLFSLQFNYISRHSMIYNMPGGGLLTVTSKTNFTSFEFKYHFYLTMFREDGFAYKPMPFMELRCGCSVLLGNFFQDENGDFCFSVLPYENNPTFFVKCYPIELLTQPVTGNLEGEYLKNILFKT